MNEGFLSLETWKRIASLRGRNCEVAQVGPKKTGETGTQLIFS